MLRSIFLAALAVLVAVPLRAQTPEVKLTSPVTETAGRFGLSVSIDGSRAIVSSRIGAEAFVYAYDGATWQLEARLPIPDGVNSHSQSVAILGDRAVVSNPDIGPDGAVYVFAFDGATWTQQARLVPSGALTDEFFGSSVSLSGDRLLVGAAYSLGTTRGAAYVFAFDGATWTQEAKLLASDGNSGDRFGHDVSLSGDRALIGALGDDGNHGSAYIFDYAGGAWRQTTKLRGTEVQVGDQFGISVSLTGNRALVGADEGDSGGNAGGRAYVFTTTDGTTWTQQQRLTASDRPVSYSDRRNDNFGISVALSGDEALIGAYSNQAQSNGKEGPGAAYRFTFADGVWTEQERIVASDAANEAWFGYAVSLSEGVGIVGAPFANAGTAGAAYIYGEPVIRPDPLSLRLLADPDPIRSGDPFTVTLEVTNDSDAPLTALTPELTLTLTGDADAQFTAGPTPASVASLAAGASARFTYTLDASGGAGSARFSANVEGRDALGETVRAELRRTIPFENPALAARLVATPSSSRAGNAFEVAVTVENVSDGPLRNVRPLAPPTITTTGAIPYTLDAGPTPAGPVTLAVGASETFRYTVMAADATFLRFSVRFGGDTEAGLAVSPVQAVETIEVRPSQTILAELRAFRDHTAPDPTPAGPDPVFTEDETFLVRLIVTNDLEVAVSGISPPSPLTVAGEGGVTLVSGPTPAGPVTLQPGEDAFFDYVFEADSQGPVQFSASVLGEDPEGQDVASNDARFDARVRVYVASIVSASGPRLHTGLQPSTVPAEIRFVRYEDTEAGKRPVCESGCADLIVQVRDTAGDPVEDVDVWARLYTTGTPLEGVDGGYFCERVVLGQSAECTPAVNTSLLKVRTDADGRVRLWIALPAAAASGTGDLGRELVARVAFDFRDIDDPAAELTLPVVETVIYDQDGINLRGNAGDWGAMLYQVSQTAGRVSLGEWCETGVGWVRDQRITAARLTRYQRNVLLFWGGNQIVPWTCSIGVDLAGLVGSPGALIKEIDGVADPLKKVTDLLKMTWFVQEFGIDKASDLLQLNGPLPPPVVAWVAGDVIGFADEVAAGVAASFTDSEAGHRIVIQEASSIPQPFGATSESDFEPTQFSGVLRMRETRGSAREVESLLSEGYKPVLRRSIGSAGYLVDNDNVAAQGARLAMVEATPSARRLDGERTALVVEVSAPGATDLRVDAWEGEVGEYVEVGWRSELPEIVQVSSVERPASGEPMLSFTTPLQYAHPEGAVVERIAPGTLTVPAPPILVPELGPAAPATLAWVSEPTALAASYRLQVATDTTAGALALVIDEDGIVADSLIVDPARFAEGTDYSWRVRARSGVGEGPWSRWQTFRPGTGVATEAEAPVAAVGLGAPFPNPTRAASASVSVELPEAGPARLAVYDALGREVAVALDGLLAAGRHAVALDTSRLPSGVYVVRLETGGAVAVQRLTVVR